MIETSRLILRHWKASDLTPFADMNADPAVMRHFPGTLTEAETEALYHKYQNHFYEFGYGFFALELKSSNSFIGFTGLKTVSFESHFTPSTEIGWRIASAYWNLGLATEAAKAALACGFHHLGLLEIVSFTATSNLASERIMQKIGMKKSGNFDHPMLLSNHPLSKHKLYRLRKEIFLKLGS